jgi:hypothetical protein
MHFTLNEVGMVRHAASGAAGPLFYGNQREGVATNILAC